jgi:C-terminal processing protease CtpA/Prc
MNMDGVYIRSIAPGSVAADEGSLRVGDRICKVDGQTVFNENPSSIAKILKDAPDVFEIKVSRRT